MTLLTILSSSDLKSNSNNDHYVPLLPDLIFGIISVVHFHHFSTHSTYGTRILVVCAFRRIENRFTVPEMRCLVKRVNSDCLRKLRNFTC